MNNFTQILSEVFEVFSIKEPFLSLKESNYFLLDKFNILKILKLEEKENIPVQLDKLRTLVNNLDYHLLRLNHLGVGYLVKDIDREILKYKESIDPEKYEIVSEQSDDPSVGWYFIKELNKDLPMFEISLSKKFFPRWTPHFQIDFDTDLTIQELSYYMNVLGSNFFDWRLDIPNYGVVVVMGVLGVVDGITIRLGLGTSLRKSIKRRKI
ncbi:MAG: hypothetical protein UT63_C0004G0024 [Candidatus Gottesmanbacteria bacterium GW2011_GWC2_39_8]|uniref:Uncharacterized protein n=1 Tax=Candidatus Gottesmanbacteria bacterium GW2011_GWC2_39_8 TaxID=1618450 RepID=A0A0G0T8P7_9BACT|nr:MAG: hypothetical protein UT63_C0004G0024 [Candidatus Gottesmanbacteria bacterium GW2011_GWC2_39_8]